MGVNGETDQYEINTNDASFNRLHYYFFNFIVNGDTFAKHVKI